MILFHSSNHQNITFNFSGRSGLVPSTFVRELGVSRSGELSSYGTTTQGRGQKTYEHNSTAVTENSRNSGMRSGSVDILRDDVVGKIQP